MFNAFRKTLKEGVSLNLTVELDPRERGFYLVPDVAHVAQIITAISCGQWLDPSEGPNSRC